jgi:hypothetical protein
MVIGVRCRRSANRNGTARQARYVDTLARTAHTNPPSTASWKTGDQIEIATPEFDRYHVRDVQSRSPRIVRRVEVRRSRVSAGPIGLR